MSGQTSKPKDPVTLKTDLSQIHILIAEDEPINLFVVAKMLQARNAIVSKASNGTEVIEMLSNGLKPDIILLDINMPGLNGYDTIEKIKEMDQGFHVIAFTASILDSETEKKLKDIGFSGAIPKPFEPEILFSKILSTVASRN